MPGGIGDGAAHEGEGRERELRHLVGPQERGVEEGPRDDVGEHRAELAEQGDGEHRVGDGEDRGDEAASGRRLRLFRAGLLPKSRLDGHRGRALMSRRGASLRLRRLEHLRDEVGADPVAEFVVNRRHRGVEGGEIGGVDLHAA